MRDLILLITGLSLIVLCFNFTVFTITIYFVWNITLTSIFEQLPEISIYQAFGLALLTLLIKPQVNYNK